MKIAYLPLLALAAALASPVVAQYAAVPLGDADQLAAQMRVIGANPTDVVALTQAGELSTRLGDLSAAASLFARADKVDPRNGRVKAGMAAVLLHLERPGEALSYYNQAEGYGYPVARFAAERGLAYDLVAQQGRAQRDYRLALASGAGDDETVRRYALSLGISGQKEAALQQLEPLLRRNDRAGWRARAFVLAMNGEAGAAITIATTMMAPGQASGMTAFFARLPALGPAERAFAVQFGEVRPTPQRLADLRFAPALAPLASETVAVARPAPRVQVAAARPDKRKRPRKDEVQLAAVIPPPAPALLAPPAYGTYAPTSAGVARALPVGPGGFGARPPVAYSAPRALPARSPLPPPPTTPPRQVVVAPRTSIPSLGTLPSPRQPATVAYRAADTAVTSSLRSAAVTQDRFVAIERPGSLLSGYIRVPSAPLIARQTMPAAARPMPSVVVAPQTTATLAPPAPLRAAPRIVVSPQNTVILPMASIAKTSVAPPAIAFGTAPPLKIAASPVIATTLARPAPQATATVAAKPLVTAPVAQALVREAPPLITAPEPKPAGPSRDLALLAGPSKIGSSSAAPTGLLGSTPAITASPVAPVEASASSSLAPLPATAVVAGTAAVTLTPGVAENGSPAVPGFTPSVIGAPMPQITSAPVSDSPIVNVPGADAVPSVAPPLPASVPPPGAGFSVASVGVEPAASEIPAGLAVISPAPTDQVLARIVSALPVPASELNVAAPPKPVSAPKPARQVAAAAASAPVPARAHVVRPENMASGRKHEIAAVQDTELEPKKGQHTSTGNAKRREDQDDAAPVKGRRAALAKADAESKPTRAKHGREIVADDEPSSSKHHATDAKPAARKTSEKHEAEPQKYWVQVAGGANEASLGKAWSTAQAKAPALAGRKGYTAPLHATNRVLAGPFKTDDEARAFVNTLNKQGVHAFQFTNDKGQKVKKLGDD